MYNVYEVLVELRNTSSTNKKVEVLKNNDTDLLRKVLLYGLNPFKQFYIRKIPAYVNPFPSEEVQDLDWALNQLDVLSNREKTGNAGIDHLHMILSSLTEEDSHVIEKVIGKDFRAGIASGLVNKAFPDLIPQFEIQLAAQWDEKNVDFSQPMYADQKMDGLRVLAFIENRAVTYLSRGGKEIETLDHLTPELLKYYPDGTVIDGEGLAGDSFQNAMSIIKRDKKSKKEDDIFLYAFDILTIDEFKTQTCESPYWKRRENLVHSPHLLTEPKYLKFTTPVEVTNLEDAMAVYAQHKADGFEGTILKKQNSLYAFKRNSDWMKIKPLETADVTITKIVEGSGRNAGRMGNIEFEFEGKEGSVGTGFSDDERVWFWEHRNELPGAIIEIMFMERTEVTENGGGIPRHSRYVALRTYKSERC